MSIFYSDFAYGANQNIVIQKPPEVEMEGQSMSIKQVVNAVDTAINKLPYMEGLYNQLKDELDKMQSTKY
jgi:hypothetical protein